MNKITKLSPAAQAVHDAFWSHPNGKPLVQDCPDTDQLVAALRAAVDQVVPLTLEEELFCRNHSLSLQKMVEIRLQLLAIAAELDSL